LAERKLFHRMFFVPPASRRRFFLIRVQRKNVGETPAPQKPALLGESDESRFADYFGR
jgi:hypothetical protein